MPTRDELSNSFFIFAKDNITNKVSRVAVPTDFQVGTLGNPAELQLLGRLSFNTREVNARNGSIIDMSDHDTILCVSSDSVTASGSVRINLPSRPRDGQFHYVKDISGFAGDMHIELHPQRGYRIESGSFAAMSSSRGSISCFWRRTGWHVFAVGGTVRIDATTAFSSGGGDVDASYVTLGNSSDLTNERILNVGQGLAMHDSGSNSNVTVQVWSAGHGGSLNWTEVLDINFAQLTSSSITTGSNNIGGINWTAQNVSNALDFGVVPGEGLRIRPVGATDKFGGTGYVGTNINNAPLVFFQVNQVVPAWTPSNNSILRFWMEFDTFQQNTTQETTWAGIGHRNFFVNNIDNDWSTAFNYNTAASGSKYRTDNVGINAQVTSDINNDYNSNRVGTAWVLTGTTKNDFYAFPMMHSLMVDNDLAFPTASLLSSYYLGSLNAASPNYLTGSNDLCFGFTAYRTNTANPNFSASLRRLRVEIANSSDDITVGPFDPHAGFIVAQHTASMVGARLLQGRPGINVADGGPGTQISMGIDNRVVATVSGTRFTGPVSAGGGLTGSLQQVSSGLAYLISGPNVTINTASNGQVSITGSAAGSDSNPTFLVLSSTSSLNNERVLTVSGSTGLKLVDAGANSTAALSINDSIVATVSGTTFTGATIHNAGLSGSLTRLTDGTSYIVAGANTAVTTQSNGSVLIETTGTGGGSGGDSQAAYVVLALTGSLLNERLLTSGSGISIVDAGANSTVTVGLNVVAGTGITLSTASNGQVTIDGGWKTALDINFSTLSSQSISDGNNTIAGYTWIAKNVAAASHGVSIAPGDGLSFNMNGTNSNLYYDTHTGAQLVLPLGSIVPSWTRSTDFRLYWQAASGSNSNANFEGIVLGLKREPFVANQSYSFEVYRGYDSGLPGVVTRPRMLSGSSEPAIEANTNGSNNVGVIEVLGCRIMNSYLTQSIHPYSTSNSVVFVEPALMTWMPNTARSIQRTTEEIIPFLTGSSTWAISMGAQTGNTTDSFTASIQRIRLDYR